MSTETEALRELQQRLNAAADRLAGLIDDDFQPTRLHGKREGVLLAESYVAEMLRERADTYAAPACDLCADLDEEAR